MDWKNKLKTNNTVFTPTIGDRLAEQEKRLEELMKHETLAKTSADIHKALRDAKTKDKAKDESNT